MENFIRKMRVKILYDALKKLSRKDSVVFVLISMV